MNVKKLLLFILIIIIVLSGYLCIYSNHESFENSNMNEEDMQIIESIKTGLSNKLNISPRRIKNLTYTGEPKQFTDNKLQVNFDIADRNQFEMNEKTTQELKKDINNYIEDGLFIIRVGDQVINLASKNFSITTVNDNNPVNNNLSNQNETFQDEYIKNYDPRFDNINIIKAAHHLVNKYKMVPDEPELQEFIKLETKNGMFKAIPDTLSCL